MKKLIKSFSISFLVVFALMLTFNTGAQALGTVKVGSTEFLVFDEEISLISATNDTPALILLSGEDFPSTGFVVTIAISNPTSPIIEGDEFDLNSKESPISMSATIISTSFRTGTSKKISSDKKSIVSGKLKFTEINPDGSFNIEFNAKIKRPVISKINLRRSKRKKKKRSKKALKVSGDVFINPSIIGFRLIEGAKNEEIN